MTALTTFSFCFFKSFPAFGDGEPYQAGGSDYIGIGKSGKLIDKT